VRTLIGGVGYRWQRDASFGLVVSDNLAQLEWPESVEVADLGYGAIYVTQDLRNASPPYDRLILITSAERDREPGSLHQYSYVPVILNHEELQERIREAGAGVIDIDHLLYIADYFQALPDEVLVYEIEPADSEGGEGLSPVVLPQLENAVQQIRTRVMAGITAGAA
jgi:hydrogenase maturation protease